MLDTEKYRRLSIAAGQRLKEKEYWLDQLSGEWEKSGFPRDHRWTLPLERRMEMHSTRIPDELFLRLSGMSKQSDYTLHIILYAALAVLLNKYTGSDDIVIGTPIYRQESEADYINSVLPIRTRLEGDITFKKLLAQARQTIMEAIENRNYPIEILARDLNRSDSKTGDFPLFDVAILLEKLHDKNDLREIQYNMLFSFSMLPGGMEVGVEFNSLVYDNTAIERILGHFITLLQEILFDVDTPIPGISILSAEEKHRLLKEYNATEVKYPGEKTIHRLFTEQGEQTPGNIALQGPKLQITRYKPVQLTYRELSERSDRLAHMLIEKGVQPDTIVGIMVERSVELIMGILAILKAGGAYLPIDPEYPPDRIDYMLKDSGAKVLLSERDLNCQLPITNCQWSMSALDGIGQSPGPKSSHPTHHTQPTNQSLAYVIYTSGSTGKPKGVLVEHRNVNAYINAFYREFNIDERDIALQQASCSFDVFVEEVYPILLRGGKIAVAPKEIVLDPEALYRFLLKYDITVISVSPLLLDEIDQMPHSGSIRVFISGGDILKNEYVSHIASRGRGILYNTYGPTETTVCATYYKYSPGDYTSVPIGKPIANYKVYILNRTVGLLPIGLPGELCIAGDGVARGYLNRPGLTREKFITYRSYRSYMTYIPKKLYKTGDPAARGTYKSNILYRTGDLARWLPDGNIEFLGRIDHQVKIRGFRIELGEIENRLLEYPGIKEAAVINRDNENGDKYLCAYVVSAPKIPGSEMREYLEKYLPGYMIPAYFVPIEKIPLTPSGKPDKKGLPAPGMTGGEVYVAPRSREEEKLAQIWTVVLGGESLPASSIGIDDNFFRLGGHSLKATILESRIHKELNIKVPLGEIFKTPTIRGISEYIKRAAVEKYEAIRPTEAKEYYPLAPAQKRLYILQQMIKEDTTYNISNVIPLAERIEKAKIETVFKELLERHESLRTFFITVKEEPVQLILEKEKVDFSIRQTHTPGLEIEDIISNFFQPFDLSQAPLLRVDLLTLDSSRQILLVDMHHIITDGASHAILEKEFLRLYSGEKLPPLRLQYRDYAAWQDTEPQKLSTKKQERYWIETFSGEVPVLNLPTDYPRPKKKSFAGSQVEFLLTMQESRILKELGTQTGATVFMCILSLFTILLYRLSGQEDIVIGTPIAARRHADMEKIIGMFVNTLPLRNTVCGEKSYIEFLQELKNRTLEAYENQEYPFEELVDKISVKRDIGRNPLFDVVFNLFNIGEYKGKNPGKEKEQYPYRHRKGRAKFDLALTAVDLGERFLFTMEYCSRLFEPGTVDRFVSYFRRLLDSLSTGTHRKLFEMEIISEEELRRVLYEFNNTAVEYPRRKSINDLFAENVERTPDHIAVVGPSVGSPHEMTRQITYRELDEKSRGLALFLIEKGVSPGTIVGIRLERSHEMIIGLLGILKAGGVYMPIDPDYPRERIDFMLKDSGTLLVMTAPILEEAIHRSYKSHMSYISPGDTQTSYSPDFLTTQLPNSPHLPAAGRWQPATSLAYIIYTSGTTGRPKGVMVEHRGVTRLVRNSNYIRFSQRDRLLLTGAAAFDITTFETWGPLCNGITLHLATKEAILNPGKMKEVLLNHDISILHLIPQLFNRLAAQDIGLFAGLRCFLVGGDLVQPVYINRLREKYPHMRILHMYGPTENTTFSTHFSIDKEYKERIPIGKPTANSTAYVMDGNGHLQPIGIAGELWVGGDGVSRGYMNNPELTGERFVINHLSSVIKKPKRDVDSHSSLVIGASTNDQCPMTNDRSHPHHSTTHHSLIYHSPIYRTGDLARWLADGNIEFLGRIDQQVKIRGFRIEPGEIESLLYRFPGINEAVVILREDEDGDKNLWAFICSEAPLVISGVKDYLSARVPAFMMPSHFVPMEKIPKTTNGKIDRKRLALMDIKIDAPKIHTAPKTEIEILVAETWKEVLKIDMVDVDDIFFDIGGNSLKVIQVNNMIKERLKKDIPVLALFEYSTIRTFSDYLLTEFINKPAAARNDTHRSDSTPPPSERLHQAKNRINKLMRKQ